MHKLAIQCHSFPHQAEFNAVKVELGDVVMAMTDGVSDNLSTNEIVQILNNTTDITDTYNLAVKIVNAAIAKNLKPDDVGLYVGIITPMW